MARARKYGEDLTVAEWHRNALPVLYQRIGHRLDMADRDWTEFCHFCKEPLAIWESVIDRGQDLNDKATTVTRKLAEQAHLPSLLVAARIERPSDVDYEINQLNARIRHLEGLHPIRYFHVKALSTIANNGFTKLDPDGFASQIFLLHRLHHHTCTKATYNHPVVKEAAMYAALESSSIWMYRQERLRF